ncbi:MAG: gluconokinase [Myxococcota bacterium]
MTRHNHTHTAGVVIIVMGVSGSGKTTFGRQFAEAINARFAEGDDYHPPNNVAKMSSGAPLTDEDRQAWLDAMAADIDIWLEQGERVVLSSSALKRTYRDTLMVPRPDVELIYLRSDREPLRERLKERRGHFMPSELLDSQFDALQEPSPDECAIILDALAPLEENVERARRVLDL